MLLAITIKGATVNQDVDINVGGETRSYRLYVPTTASSEHRW